MMMGVLPERPYPDQGMGVAWDRQPMALVNLRDLVATQEQLGLAGVLMDHEPTRVRPLHVVRWRGQLYLDNGHHRAVRALLTGRDRAWAHVLELGDTP